MNSFVRNSFRLSSRQRLPFSTTLPSTDLAKPVALKLTSSGSTFFQRLTSFLAGLGIGLGATFLLISNELSESNEKILTKIERLEARIQKVEK